MKMLEDGPEITAIEKAPTDVLTEFDGILEAVLAGVAVLVAVLTAVCICIRRRGIAAAHNKLGKRHGPERPLAFRPPKRPTAVRSPGGGTHYLKKSPSPTGVAKTPPGTSGPATPASPPAPIEPPKISYHSETEKGAAEARTPPTPNKELPGSQVSIQEPIIPKPGDNGIVEVSEDGNVKLGQLHFKIRYKHEKSSLIVSVVKCEDLPAKDPNLGSSDPYVKLQLLPDKQHKVKTRVVRKTRNPVYDEDFTFYGINFNQLSTITLHFVVLSFDRYSRDDIIGEVFCALGTVDLSRAGAQALPLCREIQPRSLKIRSQGRGELLLSLCWQPAANRLTVVLLKARNLPKMDVTGLADPYVKMYLLYNGQRIAKKKTHVKKRTLNPVFNESFVFDIPAGGEGLENVSLEFLLLDWDRVTKNEVIGRLELGGTKTVGSALHHWNEVCNSPRRQIADWHKLRE